MTYLFCVCVWSNRRGCVWTCFLYLTRFFFHIKTKVRLRISVCVRVFAMSNSNILHKWFRNMARLIWDTFNFYNFSRYYVIDWNHCKMLWLRKSGGHSIIDHNVPQQNMKQGIFAVIVTHNYRIVALMLEDEVTWCGPKQLHHLDLVFKLYYKSFVSL